MPDELPHYRDVGLAGVAGTRETWRCREPPGDSDVCETAVQFRGNSFLQRIKVLLYPARPERSCPGAEVAEGMCS